MTTLTGQQVAEAGLTGWAYLLRGLQTRIHTGDFRTGLSVVAAIGTVVDGLSPELNVRREHVDVRVSTPDERGVTERDVRLARAITAIALGASVRLDATSGSRLEFALDTPARDAVLPFWAAVLAVDHAAGPTFGHELRDPAANLPTFWFQASGDEEPRQRWHPDVWVDPSQAKPRIDAALAAGGTLVSDADAPSYWVLADPEGNRVCLCTWEDRG
jgi:4a-hydroxytetrahydrobiopterin dehydratase